MSEIVEIEYGSKAFDDRAWHAIDRGAHVAIVVHGWRARFIDRGLRFHEAYKQSIKDGRRKLTLLSAFALYAFPTVSFWGLINHARMNGMMSQREWVSRNTLRVEFLK